MRLKAKVAEELETIGVTVDSNMHKDLEKIMEEKEKKPSYLPPKLISETILGVYKNLMLHRNVMLTL